MSPETTCRFEELDRGILAVTLRPELNEIPWTDIERIGAGIVGRVAGRDRPRVIIDLTELSHMGSAMVALVVRVWKAVSEKNGKMIVVNQNDFVGEVLDVSGLADKWTIVGSRDQAQQSFSGGGSAPSTVIPGETKAGVVLSILSGVFLLLALLGLADLYREGAVASSLGQAAAFWIAVGCAVVAAVIGVLAVLRTFGNLKLVAVVLTTLSVVTALASFLFVS